MTLNDIKMFSYLEKENYTLAGQVRSIYDLTLETMNGISHSYNNYTMHDMNHGLRVASYMEQLAFGIDDKFDLRMKEFNAFEIALMLISAMLHDIGMTIRPQDREDIRNNKIKYTDTLTYEGVLSVMDNNEDEAIKEIIRRTHAARIEEFISYEFDDKKDTISKILQIDNSYPYADDIIDICKAHGEEHSFLSNMCDDRTKGNFTYNPRFIASLLRIADYLDIDKQRTPILWYSIMKIDGFSKEEWEKHFIIQNNTKLKEGIGGKLQIYFDGKSSDAKIHRKYLKYVDDLKKELENTDELLNTKTQVNKYSFNISTKIDDRVRTEGFKYSDLRLNLDYSAITDLLMGKNIYGDKRLGLRELIQNSIDACNIMKEIGEKDPDVVIIDPAVSINYSKNKKYVKVKDTGIGMTIDVVKRHFLNVGKSYYNSNDFLFKNYDYQPIGHYGIGFLACFLLSDNVVVKTKHYLNHEINQIELEKNSEYVVTRIQETANFCGTEITLDYEKFFEVFKTAELLQKFLEEYFYTDIALRLKDDDSGKVVVIKNPYIDKSVSVAGVENEKYKYDLIDCEKLTSNIEGKLIVRTTKNKKTPTLELIDEEKTYIYNADQKLFAKCANSDKLEGYYFIYEYSNGMTEEIYNSIKRNRKGNKLTSALIAQARENDNDIFLFIPCEKPAYRFDYRYYNDNLEEMVLEAIVNSGFFCCNELIERCDPKLVFISDNKYMRFYTSLLGGYYWYDEDDKMIFDPKIYNKGILAHRERGLVVKTLFPNSTIFGCVNCKNLPIKLDVSRSYVLEGRDVFINEFNCIILQYENNSISQSEIKDFVNKTMLYDNQKIKRQPR